MNFKKILIVIISLLAYGVSWAGGIQDQHKRYLARINAGGSSFCSGTEPLCTDFENNETCVADGWTVNNSPDCQATDQAIDTYSMKMANSGSTPDALKELTSALDPVYIKFSFRADSLPGYNYIVSGRINADTGRFAARLLTTTFDCRWNGIATSPALGISADTWYTVKIRANKDTGASDGAMYVWLSAGENVSLSTDTGAADAEVTGQAGGYTSDITHILFRNDENTENIWFDNIKVMGTDPDA